MIATLAVVVAGGLIIRNLRQSTVTPTCSVASGSGTYKLDLGQAANATTIAAVGLRMGLPDHAVTVALAAALQESKLRNLDHGDLDSLGLFQQRPSQGWGTPAQLMVPRFAAAAFYQALTKVDGWASLPVTEAAQQVQRSAAPSAYAQWEAEARALAIAVTGEAPAGLACQFAVPSSASDSAALGSTIAAELGAPAVGETVAPARGWTVANWLVGHASTYRIVEVSFLNYRWTPASGKWTTQGSSVAQVQMRQA